LAGAAVCAGAGVGAAAGALGVCVEAGADAVELAGGATMGGAACRAGPGPLLAAMGAAAQVPTQWSGSGGAACAAAVKASTRSRLGRIRRCERVVTAECQPRMKFSGRTILRRTGGARLRGCVASVTPGGRRLMDSLRPWH